MKYDNFLGNPSMPLSKETDSTYGGTKPGKAPTLKQPTPPDPYKLIEEQAKANRVNESGPMGSLTYSRDPSTGVWTANKEFSPELQGLYDQRIGMVGSDINAPDLPSSSDFSADADKLEKATFDRTKMLLDPQFSQEEEQMRSRLANQGIMPGSEAYRNEFDPFAQRKREAYNAAALGAVGAGRQEQGRLFGQSMDVAKTGFGHNLQRRQQLYNELASLIGTQQIGPTGQLDVLSPFAQQYQGQIGGVNATNQANAARNAQTTSTGATALTALLMALSDRRVKKNVEKIGQLPSGLNVYKFEYLWDDEVHIGVMADEVEKVFPGAVSEISGLKIVDYAKVH